MSTTRLKLAKWEVPARLTCIDIRRAKSDWGIDFADTTEGSPILRMETDPLVLSEVIWALYEPKLTKAGCESLAVLEEELSSEQMTEVRAVVSEALGGFFPLAKMVSTKMRDLLSGDLSLEEMATVAATPNLSGSTS